MRIGLDFDGVITDCGKLKSEGARRLYEVDIPPERFKTELVVGAGILTKEQYKYLQTQIYETSELGSQMEIVEGAFYYISKLLEENHDICIVTSRNNLAAKIAKEWLDENKLDLPLTAVAGIPKTEACKGLEVYVDDDLDKLEPLVNIVPKRFLFSWGYNTHIDVDPKVAKRVSSWSDLYQKIIK